ncbi:MAG: hypothetical protein RR741_00010 [Erysipelotrichaceae bacterium]
MYFGYKEIIDVENYEPITFARLEKMNVNGIIENATKICDRHFKIANSLDISAIFLAQHFENQISTINEGYLAEYKIQEDISVNTFGKYY